MLKNLDINDGLLDTTGNIKLRWRWGDAPHKFDWKLVQGDAVLTLRNGTLKDLNAGAGRLLGLLSFKTLLSLDFGDQQPVIFPSRVKWLICAWKATLVLRMIPLIK